MHLLLWAVWPLNFFHMFNKVVGLVSVCINSSILSVWLVLPCYCSGLPAGKMLYRLHEPEVLQLWWARPMRRRMSRCRWSFLTFRKCRRRWKPRSWSSRMWGRSSVKRLRPTVPWRQQPNRSLTLRQRQSPALRREPLGSNLTSSFFCLTIAAVDAAWFDLAQCNLIFWDLWTLCVS